MVMSQLVFELFGVKMKQLTNSSSSSSPLSSHSPKKPTSQTLSSPSLSSVSGSENVNSGRDNLSPLLSALESKNAFYLIYDYQRFTLFDCVVHSPAMFEGSYSKTLFVIYQLMKLISFCHSKGVTLGDISLKNVYIDSRLWLQYCLQPMTVCPSLFTRQSEDREETLPQKTVPPASFDLKHSRVVSNSSESSFGKTSDFLSSYSPPSLSLSDAVQKWRNGYLSTFDYLMLLNYYAGRRIGEPNNHPIFPWVMDFTEKNGVLRDFSLSKHRQAKGDHQLDFTYQSALDEAIIGLEPQSIPHHISEIASDVTYYVYMARRTPRDVLCAHVRPRWVPEEYPASMEKMYTWTPDESIPEFFTSPELFQSIHSDLPDLCLPKWCSSPEEFISMHRHFLESDSVSFSLHNWIDLMFGFKLSGEAAVRSKNVYLSLVDGHTMPTNSGIVQLFRSSHPKRLRNSSAPLLINQWETQLGLSSLMDTLTFNTSQWQSHGNERKILTEEADNDRDAEKTLQALLDDGIRQGSHLGPQNSSEPDHDSFEYVSYPYGESGRMEDNDLTIIPAETSSNPTIGILGVTSGKVGGAPISAKVDPTQVPSEGTGKPFLRSILRVRRSNPGDQDAYEWQGAPIAVPKEANPLQTLSQVEELSHFLTKSCRNGGDSIVQWSPEDLLLLKVTS